MPLLPRPCEAADTPGRVSIGPIVQNGLMVHVPKPMIEDLRHELASFKTASGAYWACAAVQLAGAVEALLDETDCGQD